MKVSCPEFGSGLNASTLAACTRLVLDVAEGDLAWFQVLRGELDLEHAGRAQRLTDSHVVFLPPRFAGSVRSESPSSLLFARVPDAANLDPAFVTQPPAFRVVDWRSEPLLESKHDARKRIYLATPALFGTQAIKGEMIIYPPRTEAPRHYHVGAAHFMYFLSGSGTAYAEEKLLRCAKVTSCTTTTRKSMRCAVTSRVKWSSRSSSFPPAQRPSGWNRTRRAPGCRPARTSRAASHPGRYQSTASRNRSRPQGCNPSN